MSSPILLTKRRTVAICESRRYQRGSWHQPAQEEATLPWMTGANFVCVGHLLPAKGFAERNTPGYRCMVAPYYNRVGISSGFLQIVNHLCQGQYNLLLTERELQRSIIWSSVSSPGQIRKLSSIPPHVQRRWVRAFRVSSDIRRSNIFFWCW